MLILVVLGAYYATTPGYCKQITLYNLLNLGLFVIPTFYGGAAANKPMWEIQFALSIIIAIVGLYLELAGITGPWGFEMPKCDTKLAQFNTFQLFWLLPFVFGFLFAPSELFGPKAISGFPMFMVEFGETSLWITKAWAVATFMLALGPFLFGLKPQKVAKQIIASYIANTAIFTYGLLQTKLFNMMVMGPLTGVNVLLLIWGVYVICHKDTPDS